MTPSQNSPIPVVFLQGIGGAARLWDPQVASFAAAGYRPVALDLPGYGDRPPVDHMDFEMLAADVEAAIDARQLDRPVIVGHSLGGMIAQTCLRRRPDGYRAAVLSGTSPAFGNPSGDFQKKFVADRLAPLDAGQTMADMAGEVAQQLMGPNADPANRALLIEVMGSISPRTYRAAVQCLVNFDERGNLAAIRTPVLCLVGDLDRNAPPAMMEKMAGKIPAARYVLLAGLGHMPNLEAPDRYDAAIMNFLRDVKP
ncbi:MAG: alpha/beta fold hydrolase [Rhodopseudomonas sp.]|nr:alpha/beta fold hydrolase [Rhodopseudomonas sp.]